MDLMYKDFDFAVEAKEMTMSPATAEVVVNSISVFDELGMSYFSDPSCVNAVSPTLTLEIEPPVPLAATFMLID